MANETELANLIHQTDIVSAVASEALIQNENIFPLIHTQPLPANTNVIKFRKRGSLTAAAGTESTGVTYGAGNEITETAITATATRKDGAAKLTVEAARFNERGSMISAVESVVQEASGALVRLAAADLKTLFSSVSGGVTATSVLTKDDILDARYTVRNGIKSAGSNMLVGMFDYKGVNELDKELTDLGAAAFQSQVDLGMLGIASAGTPRGSLFDVAIYETSGLPTSGSDDVACVWDPMIAFAAGIDTSGMYTYVQDPLPLSPWFEIYVYSFWSIVEWNDAAAVKVLSDT